MSAEEITILRVHKRVRDELRKRAITKRESYEEIIERLLGAEVESGDKDELERRKQKMLKEGVSKEVVELVGILPKNDVAEDKKLIGEAIRRWAARKGW